MFARRAVAAGTVWGGDPAGVEEDGGEDVELRAGGKRVVMI